MSKEAKRILDVINVFDAAGVYAITSKMISDYFESNHDELTGKIIDTHLKELSASDFIVWDATQAYFRPVRY
tara:strand:+ start:678 stop:893 length:216 start_codon:yes stop_codon:yes gene_type:complete